MTAQTLVLILDFKRLNLIDLNKKLNL
jgi:hypothetical protein